ncbi:DUF3301 domain-containing protein [Pseudomonas umsongensis]|jgi:hypothetical protein|uniref:DUF3301 domain-containing protein n=1 Tax=Pseudomonas umsongensis TaxID=198618 RepID=A0AAE7DC10_9PSED|nr:MULTISPECIES: DUF3301 domain-containing protein [Pseudomonas]KEX95368.1 hypothetical protein HA62_26495 [Pseudomonas putida]EPA96353.1 hypothetical protein PG5_30840 [Pseudomonas sp. G5(2012)]MBT9569957.1 DUF3301 domain-containing protein [Pseudomonas umsongensis]MDI3390950.1 DUF3301 domain-containing protein [Pseudomonas sp. V98_8]NWL19833.1 DUF3301 domain-containing protein [Pseudomonas umsongensis]
MLTLGNILVLMLFATAAAWLWHNHGLREHALERVKQHCAKLGIELLDGNVALKKIAFIKDANGRRRLARVYNFEFTVTGETRHNGTITQFGPHSAQIELAPYPVPFDDTATVVDVVKPRAEVIELSQWRQEHTKWRP